MTKHEKATILYTIIESVRRIKDITASAQIDDLSVSVISLSQKLVDGMGLDEDIKVIRERRIDKTG